MSESVKFSLERFTVSFTETGLTGTVLAKHEWTVVLNGTWTWSTSETVGFPGVPNGTYDVLVTGPSGYTATGSGTVRVSGTTTVPVTIAKGKTATLTFGEKGLTKGTNWCMALDSAAECSITTSIKFLDLTPGYENQTGDTYSYAVASPTVGQHLASSANATITLLKSTKVVERFSYEYAVTFTETGLASGGPGWTVWIGGDLSNETGDPITVHLVNGTYAYKIGAYPGYTSVGSPKKIVVNGADVNVTVTFTAKKVKSGSPVELLAMPLALGAAPASLRKQQHRR